jgi:hypothetical protein
MIDHTSRAFRILLAIRIVFIDQGRRYFVTSDSNLHGVGTNVEWHQLTPNAEDDGPRWDPAAREIARNDVQEAALHCYRCRRCCHYD